MEKPKFRNLLAMTYTGMSYSSFERQLFFVDVVVSLEEKHVLC